MPHSVRSGSTWLSDGDALRPAAHCLHKAGSGRRASHSSQCPSMPADQKPTGTFYQWVFAPNATA